MQCLHHQNPLFIAEKLAAQQNHFEANCSTGGSSPQFLVRFSFSSLLYPKLNHVSFRHTRHTPAEIFHNLTPDHCSRSEHRASPFVPSGGLCSGNACRVVLLLQTSAVWVESARVNYPVTNDSCQFQLPATQSQSKTGTLTEIMIYRYGEPSWVIKDNDKDHSCKSISIAWWWHACILAETWVIPLRSPKYSRSPHLNLLPLNKYTVDSLHLGILARGKE